MGDTHITHTNMCDNGGRMFITHRKTSPLFFSSHFRSEADHRCPSLPQACRSCHFTLPAVVRSPGSQRPLAPYIPSKSLQGRARPTSYLPPSMSSHQACAQRRSGPQCIFVNTLKGSKGLLFAGIFVLPVAAHWFGH